MENSNNIPAQISPEDKTKLEAVEKFVGSFGLEKIENQESYTLCEDILKRVKTEIKALEDRRLSLVRPINDVIKSLSDFFNRPKERLSGLEAKLKSLMTAYKLRIEAEAAEAQRQANIKAEAERRAQEEKAAKLRAEAEEAAKAGDLARAEKLEAKAETREEKAALVVAPVIAPAMNKTGLYVVKSYEVEILDKKAFIESCLAKDTLEYLDIDTSMLNKEAKATKGARTWAGIKVIETTGSRVR